MVDSCLLKLLIILYRRTKCFKWFGVRRGAVRGSARRVGLEGDLSEGGALARRLHARRGGGGGGGDGGGGGGGGCQAASIAAPVAAVGATGCTNRRRRDTNRENGMLSTTPLHVAISRSTNFLITRNFLSAGFQIIRYRPVAFRRRLGEGGGGVLERGQLVSLHLPHLIRHLNGKAIAVLYRRKSDRVHTERLLL